VSLNQPCGLWRSARGDVAPVDQAAVLIWMAYVSALAGAAFLTLIVRAPLVRLASKYGGVAPCGRYAGHFTSSSQKALEHGRLDGDETALTLR